MSVSFIQMSNAHLVCLGHKDKYATRFFHKIMFVWYVYALTYATHSGRGPDRVLVIIWHFDMRILHFVIHSPARLA